MGKSLIKFIYESKERSYNDYHWDYCCSEKIPYIKIIKSGTKYWKIDFDLFPITKMERFVIMNYSEHILPLYELYVKYTNLPKNIYSASGGGRNLVFTVLTKDAPSIAEKLFDLLMLLSKRDQELFDENPYTVNKDGLNSEGRHVAKFVEELKAMSDGEIIKKYHRLKESNPFMLQTLQMVKDEITKREIKSDI
jgi:hypothetical protein